MPQSRQYGQPEDAMMLEGFVLGFLTATFVLFAIFWSMWSLISLAALLMYICETKFKNCADVQLRDFYQIHDTRETKLPVYPEGRFLDVEGMYCFGGIEEEEEGGYTYSLCVACDAGIPERNWKLDLDVLDANFYFVSRRPIWIFCDLLEESREGDTYGHPKTLELFHEHIEWFTGPFGAIRWFLSRPQH